MVENQIQESEKETFDMTKKTDTIVLIPVLAAHPEIKFVIEGTTTTAAPSNTTWPSETNVFRP
jgi:hypothetical protein